MLRPAAILLAAAAASAAQAADVQIASTGPVVEIGVTETVQVRPDQARVSAGVTTRAQTAVAAMRDNAVRMDAVVRRIKALGIAERDIQTSGISLNADYRYDDATRQQIFQGYQVTNRVTVLLRDVQRVGPVLDALVEAGANDIGGPDFSVANDTGPRGQARAAAMKRANEQALEYARAAGYSGVRLLLVTENVGQDAPRPYAARDAIVVTGSRVKTPVEPGVVGTDVTVNVTYEMTR